MADRVFFYVSTETYVCAVCCLLSLSHSALICGLDEAKQYEGVLGNAHVLVYAAAPGEESG